MTTVEEVLRRHGYALTENDIAQRLDDFLSAESRPGVAIDMTTAETDFLARYSGVRPATPTQLTELRARSTARLAAEATLALNRSEIAELLEVTPSRISHQVAAGKLYSYLGSGRRPLFPDWQIIAAAPERDDDQRARIIPQLGDVLAAIPSGSHPITVRAFMTTPTLSLTAADGAAMSPRDWLLSGGHPELVVELAASLGEQV